jgi:antitoxin VapB
MSERARIFQNGGSQAVRLPKSCRFRDGESEVVVRKHGRQVILEPVDEWPESFIAALGSCSEELERPFSGKIAELENPFDSDR